MIVRKNGQKGKGGPGKPVVRKGRIPPDPGPRGKKGERYERMPQGKFEGKRGIGPLSRQETNNCPESLSGKGIRDADHRRDL